MELETVKPGLRVRTLPALESTMGMFIAQARLDDRSPNKEGTIKSWVAGHGGDVWWIAHDDGAVGAYIFTEFEPLS